MSESTLTVRRVTSAILSDILADNETLVNREFSRGRGLRVGASIKNACWYAYRMLIAYAWKCLWYAWGMLIAYAWKCLWYAWGMLIAYAWKCLRYAWKMLEEMLAKKVSG